jgi:hypothetical protein
MTLFVIRIQKKLGHSFGGTGKGAGSVFEATMQLRLWGRRSRDALVGCGRGARGKGSRVVGPVWAKMAGNGILNLEVDIELIGGLWELELNEF